MGRLFVPGSIGLSSHKLFGQLPLPTQSGNTLVQSITVAQFVDNAGYRNPIFGAVGSITPVNATLINNDNNPILEIFYSNGTGLLSLGISNVVAQNYFTSITFGAPISATKTTATATTFDGINWQWVGPNLIPAVGDIVTITII